MKRTFFKFRKILTRSNVVLFFFFLVGLGLGLIFGSLITNQQHSTPANNAQPFLPEMVEVVVMLQTVPEGWVFTEQELTYDLRLIESVPATAITRIDDVVGHSARFDLYQGLTLTTDMIGPRNYQVLMATQQIPAGTSITGDMVRYVLVPYDSPHLTTNSMTHNDRLWTVEMTAAQDIAENTLLAWWMIDASENVDPVDPYLATKSQVDEQESIDQEGTMLSLTQDQTNQISRLVVLDYLIAGLFGAIVTAYFIRWRYRRRRLKSS